MILARTWFALGLPFEIGCDTGGAPDCPVTPPDRWRTNVASELIVGRLESRCPSDTPDMFGAHRTVR
jgi:hypothetical protein